MENWGGRVTTKWENGAGISKGGETTRRETIRELRGEIQGKDIRGEVTECGQGSVFWKDVDW